MRPQNRHISIGMISSIVLAVALTILAYCSIHGNVIGALAVVVIPFVLLWFGVSVRYPIVSLFTYGLVACFWGLITRIFLHATNISILLEIALIYFFACMLFHAFTTRDFQWKQAFNIMTAGYFLWFLYCFGQIVNPRGLTEAWINSRGFYPSFLLFAVFCSTLFTKYKYVKILVNGLAVFVIIVFLKLLMQKYIGFDEFERTWLAAGGYRTHLLSQGTRYFSIFSDAGNFGSNMGGFTLMYALLAFNTSNKRLRNFYILISIFAAIGLFMSGTRGAMIVPLGGLMLFTIISQNIKLTVASSILGIAIYVFFAFTYIGESNSQISRMRTAFKPAKDASFNVRLENQKQIAEYLKDKPFGEGLGIGGADTKKYGNRFITSVPADSYFVKIWMQTGIVGLILHISVLLTMLLWGCYLIMFKIKDRELKRILISMACMLFGLMLSAYGNQFFSQPNTQFILFTFMACILNGPYIDKEICRQKEQTQLLSTTLKNYQYDH